MKTADRQRWQRTGKRLYISMEMGMLIITYRSTVCAIHVGIGG
jgi:hypothetical protein